MSLSPEQMQEALEGYDEWVKERMLPKPDFDALSTKRYLEWATQQRDSELVTAIYELAGSDIWDDELGREVRKLIGVGQGKPRVEVGE